MTSIAAQYEAERLANIAENQRILSALFSSTTARNAPAVPTLHIYPASHSLPSKPPQAAPFISFGHAPHATPKPKPKPKARASPSSSSAASATPGRRSARNEGKERIDYSKEIVLERWEDSESPFSGKRQRGSDDGGEEGEEGEEGEWIVGDDYEEDDEDGEGEEVGRERKRQRKMVFRKREAGAPRGSGHGVKVGKRSQNPKQFGHIPGVAIGTVWRTRMQASRAAVHSPPVGGIFGNAQSGCWSIALSGGWADDVDNGDVFTYTGSGGTLLSGTKNQPKNLRVAPQTFDQSFDHSFNAALKKSCDTGKPVRVIRGYKNPSKYAPVDGYRYDGLYTVIKCWMAPSIANKNLKVCRYALQRLGGQGEIGVKQPQEGGVEVEEEGEVAQEE